VKPALFVPENNTPYQLLEKIKETRIHSCFIVNEYGTMEGMITLNDIMEAIVGDVPQTGQKNMKLQNAVMVLTSWMHKFHFMIF
jgi:putative hemolysin